jgi:two-component system cell cycle sensor histidine kinase/response regulator CckA
VVLDVLAEMLQDLGYAVLAAGSGDAALARAAAHAGVIDLLVTDVLMPGLSGPELAARLTALRPGLRVLYLSGHPDSALEATGTVLEKPVGLDALAQAVRAALEGPDAGRASKDGLPNQ